MDGFIHFQVWYNQIIRCMRKRESINNDMSEISVAKGEFMQKLRRRR